VNVVIRGATLIDGTRAPARQTDVAVADGRIAAVGDDAAASIGAGSARTIDAGGLVLAPGFIDLHSHADLTLPAFPAAINSLSQGVTTEVVGNCGFSPAPVGQTLERARMLHAHVGGVGPDLDWSWTDFGSFLDRLDERQPAVNVAPLVGHGTLRIAAMGMDNRPPSLSELEEMRTGLQAALAAGAWGMSSGLVYPPGVYAATDEVVDLARGLKAVSGLYASHIRNEGESLLDAVGEALSIGRQSGVRVQVSHLKASGRANHGRVADAIDLIESARTANPRGVDVHCDVYPYEAGSTLLSQVLPPWVHEGGVDALVERLGIASVRERVRREIETGLPGWGNHAASAGGWQNILIARVVEPALRFAEGRSVAELASAANQDPLDFVADLLIRDHGGAVMIVFLMDFADVRNALAYAQAGIGSDQLGVTSDDARVHPRAYGTFARVLGWGVREAKLFSLEEAVHKMTGLPADIMGFTDRGRVEQGRVADLVLFDPTTVHDEATYDDPTRRARGVEYVLVGGELAIDRAAVMRRDLGRVLRKASHP
jgi:N-acyl-D-amino-acid deacylase